MAMTCRLNRRDGVSRKYAHPDVNNTAINSVHEKVLDDHYERLASFGMNMEC